MKLQKEPFEMIKKGTKTIEARLFNEKRGLLSVGDEIEFSSLDESTNKIKTEILELLKYPTFSDLFDAYPPEMFGGKDKEDLMSIYKYYTKDAEKKYGVLGIRVKLISSNTD